MLIFDVDFMTCSVVTLWRSGCRRPRNEIATSPFRCRQLRASGKSGSAHFRVFYRIVGIVPSIAKAVLGIFTYRSRMYAFVRGTKLRPGTSSRRSWASLAGLRQRVVGREKDTTAQGYSVATGKALSDQALSLAESAGGFALLCTRAYG